MPEYDALVSSDATGSWGWAGFRLVPVLGGPPSHPLAVFSPAEAEARTAHDEAAWLSAQWHSRLGGRFEVRYRNEPPAAGDRSAAGSPGRLRCVCLCRVQEANPGRAAAAAVALRDQLAASLPGHVRAEPLADARELQNWLVPFPLPSADGTHAEIAKVLTARPASRPGARRQAIAAVSTYSTDRVSWEPLLRRLDALPFPAVLTVGIKCVPSSDALQQGLAQLAADYAELARPAAGSPPYSDISPGDEFAGYAAKRCAEDARRYNGPLFRLRISLAAAQPLPADLAGWLAQALSARGAAPAAGARVLLPVPGEREQAWRNIASLSGTWLARTHLGALPLEAVAPELRDLMVMADLAEARCAVQLPVAWPGRPPLYAALSAPKPAVDPWPAAPGDAGPKIIDPFLLEQQSDL